MMKLQEERFTKGDCLLVLRGDWADNSVDCIPTDSPFNSKRGYNTEKEATGRTARHTIQNYEDTWYWTDKCKLEFESLRLSNNETAKKIYRLINTFIENDGYTSISAFMVFIGIRLIEFHRILKPSGSIWFHCDKHASSEIKILLDIVFGVKNDLNHVVWAYDGPQSPGKKKLATKYDTIFRYAKNIKKLKVNSDALYKYIPYNEKELEKISQYKKDDMGWFYDLPTGDYSEEKLQKFEEEGRIRYTKTGKRRLKYYLKYAGFGKWLRKKKISDVWDDISIVTDASIQSRDYDTQKPEELLERMINISTFEGDIVFDPFCGSGTALIVAQRLRREYYGCDISDIAQEKVRKALNLYLNQIKESDTNIKVKSIDGIVDYDSLLKAIERPGRPNDGVLFQNWSVYIFGGRVNTKMVGDGGIDGWKYVDVLKGGIQCKGVEKATRGDVSQFENDIEKAGLDNGFFLCLNKPSQGVYDQAALAGNVETENGSIPKIQIYHAQELFDMNPEDFGYRFELTKKSTLEHLIDALI